MIELDILGEKVSAPSGAVTRLRDLAAAAAGRSSSARDLSLVLDRAIQTKTTVALHRGETRALSSLLETATDDELIGIRDTVQRAVTGH